MSKTIIGSKQYNQNRQWSTSWMTGGCFCVAASKEYRFAHSSRNDITVILYTHTCTPSMTVGRMLVGFLTVGPVRRPHIVDNNRFSFHLHVFHIHLNA